jgi:hypothetical protein
MSSIAAKPLTGPDTWHGRDLARSTDWIRPISAAAVAELDAALAAVKARGLAWRAIRREDFPLRAFAAELAAVAHELEHGRGVVLLRGLPVARYTEDELRQIYWGIGTHRLWLSMPNSRALPPGFEVLWGRIAAGAARGGIAQS